MKSYTGNGIAMKTNTPGILNRLMAKFGERLRAAQAQRRRQVLAAAKLRAFSVLPTRPGRLLRL